MINPHSTRHLSARYLFPSKLVEYLVTGKPVISTCSTPEVIEEYGDVMFALRNDTPDELAKQIRRIAALPDAERNAMGVEGRRRVLERKTWSVQGARIAKFVSTLVKGEQPS